MAKVEITGDTTDAELQAILARLPSLNSVTAPNWHWRKANGQIFSAAKIAYVDEDDDDYQAWLEAGNLPSPYPQDEDGNESPVELQRVLSAYNLSATLPHYARTRTWAMRVGGAVIGGEFVPTDTETLALLNGLKGLAEEDPDGSFPFDDGSERGRILTAEQAKGLAIAVGQYVQGTFTKRVTVLLAGIADGTLTSKADVDKALAPPKAKASAAKKSAK